MTESETTGGYTSAGLLAEEQVLVLPSLTNADAIEIGQIDTSLGADRTPPIAVEVRIGECIIYHAALPGAVPEHDWWIGRKARVVNLKKYSKIFE